MWLAAHAMLRLRVYDGRYMSEVTLLSRFTAKPTNSGSSLHSTFPAIVLYILTIDRVSPFTKGTPRSSTV